MPSASVYCQNCGKDTEGKPVSFYGNVVCGEACRKDLSERIYFRDDPPDPDSIWYCPHCAAENPVSDPKKELRPNCTSCGKPLDPQSATPPKRRGCTTVILIGLVLAAGWVL